MDISVIKVGGSLVQQPKKLRLLCKKIGEVSKEHRLVVIGGGGEFADVVRQLDVRFGLSNFAAHRMAILGIDQYGLMLADLIPNAATVDNVNSASELLERRGLPVFLPSKLFLEEDPLENSWDVTSDSIALYIAGQLRACRLLLVKDVDGIYTADPKKYSEAKLIEELSINELSALKQRTSVDVFMSKLLKKTQIQCYVVNGLYPKRIQSALEGKWALYTKISGEPF